MMRTALISLAIVLALGFGLLGRGRETQAQQPAAKGPPPAAVEIASATAGDFAAVQWVPGTVVSREDARIASEQSGRVVFVVEVGARAKRGDVIARLDDEALRLTERNNIAAVKRAESQLEYSAKQLARMAELKASSSVSETQVDEVENQRRMLAQDLEQARIALDETRRRVREATIRAPFDGVVAERSTQLGEFLAAGATVVRLVNTEHLEVSAQAPVAFAASLAPGAAVTLRNGSHTEQETVRAVVPIGDAASRQFAVRVGLANGAWPIGAAIEVALTTSAAKEVVAVPRDALILRGKETFVMRVDASNKAERIAVQTGTSKGDLIEVRGGAIVAGDRLVVRGGERLAPGQPVTIKKNS